MKFIRKLQMILFNGRQVFLKSDVNNSFPKHNTGLYLVTRLSAFGFNLKLSIQEYSFNNDYFQWTLATLVDISPWSAAVITFLPLCNCILHEVNITYLYLCTWKGREVTNAWVPKCQWLISTQYIRVFTSDNTNKQISKLTTTRLYADFSHGKYYS